MSALCILAAGKTIVIAASVFSLSWTHSVQKSEWYEEWQIIPAGLALTKARVKGSGAGMEPPEGSRLIDGWWVYRPKLPAQKSLVLASSGLTGGGWRLCASGRCIDLGETAGGPIKLNRCEEKLY
ncbi:DUF1850 domain-containing protein [Falsochrobactrum shanghaiense]|uniref:DUF1850 domain-containing protein n=1 Tax=Falsochrobactrum shanghaiense TaxID=2201899 RepID=A0A316J4M3_9HYPH|nr:DUF1850 domain-containing protein [Falsochrobactrum shanghaiense]PWL16336.1 DUF1850 domain-containing protein [Falsochrobactrum shanghaiense]